MSVARLLAIRRMLLTLIEWTEEELRSRGWRCERPATESRTRAR